MLLHTKLMYKIADYIVTAHIQALVPWHLLLQSFVKEWHYQGIRVHVYSFTIHAQLNKIDYGLHLVRQHLTGCYMK